MTEDARDARDAGLRNVALLAVTFERPMAIQRLIRSARASYPDLPIYVGDQSHPDPFMDAYYREHNVHVVRTGHDSGVSFSRNRVLEEIKEDYVLVSDDDVVFLPETSLEAPLRVLLADDDIGVVGGRLWNVIIEDGEASRVNLFWELTFLEDHTRRAFVTAPIHLFPKDPFIVAGERVFEADSVLNFALFRRSALNDVIRWDEQFKSNGEHEDFYLNWKHHSPKKAVYLPGFVAEHHRPPRVVYERSRQRVSGWELFMRKWGFDHHLELGYGLRTARNIDDFAEGEDLGFTSRNQHSMNEARLAYYFGKRGAEPRELRYATIRDPAVAAPVDETPVEQIALFGAYRREHVIGRDFTIYLRPEAPGKVHGASMTKTIFYSWKRDDEYVVFNTPVTLYGVSPIWSEWTAFDLAIPEIGGVLVLELLIADEAGANAQIKLTGSVLCSQEPRLGTPDDWVFGLTPAREKIALQGGKPGARRFRARREMVDVWRGARIELVTAQQGPGDDEAGADGPIYEMPPDFDGPVRALVSGRDLTRGAAFVPFGLPEEP